MSGIWKTLVGAAKSLRDYGATETFFRGLHRLRIISAVHSLDFYVNQLNVADNTAVRGFVIDRKRCEFQELAPEALKKFLIHKSLGSSDWFAEQFDRGSRLFAAVLGETVIATTWIHTKYARLTYINRRTVEMPRKFAYSHGAVTAPEFRGKKVGSLLRKFAFDILTRAGYQLVIGAVFLENGHAKQLQRSVGSLYWGKMTYLCWKGRDYWLKFLTREGKKYSSLFDRVVSEPMRKAADPSHRETMTTVA